MDKLIPIEFKNQRIITTKTLAEQYGTNEQNISKNFTRNSDRFIEGKHYFKLEGDVLKEFKGYVLNDESLKFVSILYLWTEKGAARHAKILDTDEAWEVYEELEETYFQVRENVQTLNTSQLSPELQMFNKLFQAIACQEIENKQIKEEIKETKEEIQGIRDVVALTPNAWRKDTTSLISKIAMKLGGFDHIKDVREESYKLLNDTYKVDVKRRVLNKKKNMALEGVSKSKMDKLNPLDVIAEDEKLINGYLSIISKMAIKYGAV
ncbi:ORF6N domain-containing protein [Clostridium sp.]|uniref:ORF6N domain-containing protein n=1 Tax=Clostridium sp. TaxID=1506 RepID=UPI00321718E6